jgi:hypothetical protein
MTPIEIVQHDTLPLLEFTIEKNNAVFNLSGYTVVFSMMDENGTLKVNKQPCTVVSAAAGTCTYQLQSDDTNVAGQFQGEISVVDSNGDVQTTYDHIPIVIRQQVA